MNSCPKLQHTQTVSHIEVAAAGTAHQFYYYFIIKIILIQDMCQVSTAFTYLWNPLLQNPY